MTACLPDFWKFHGLHLNTHARHESGLFFASYGVILIPGFGVAEAFHGRMHDYHNALAIFIIGASQVLASKSGMQTCHVERGQKAKLTNLSSVGGLRSRLPGGCTTNERHIHRIVFLFANGFH